MGRFLKYALLLLLVACEDKGPPPPPDNAIEKEKFVTVMVDMHLTESAINQKFRRLNDTTNVAYSYYKHLFDKHAINQTDFDSTFNYYLRYPALMLEIYKQVNDSLAALSQDLEENEDKYRKMERGDSLEVDTVEVDTMDPPVGLKELQERR